MWFSTPSKYGVFCLASYRLVIQSEGTRLQPHNTSKRSHSLPTSPESFTPAIFQNYRPASLPTSTSQKTRVGRPFRRQRRYLRDLSIPFSRADALVVIIWSCYKPAKFYPYRLFLIITLWAHHSLPSPPTLPSFFVENLLRASKQATVLSSTIHSSNIPTHLIPTLQVSRAHSFGSPTNSLSFSIWKSFK